jgi:hypothetical protein
LHPSNYFVTQLATIQLFYIFTEIKNLKNTTMKKLLFITALISWALIFSNCSKKDDTTTTQNNNNTPSGTLNASGTISFTAGGVNYSLPIKTVTKLSYSLNLTAEDTTNFQMITISVVNTTSSVTTGTYTAATSSITYTSTNPITIYQAS